MFEDRTPPIAALGFIASLTLSEVNTVVSLLVGLASLGYVITKWVLLLRGRTTKPPFDPESLK